MDSFSDMDLVSYGPNLCQSSWFYRLNSFFKSKKPFFYNPHHSHKKLRKIAEFLTDFEFFFTFVIRITFFTNRRLPRRIRERDLFYPSYSTPLPTPKFFNSEIQKQIMISNIIITCRMMVYKYIFTLLYINM